jgi:hypothetical protein
MSKCILSFCSLVYQTTKKSHHNHQLFIGNLPVESRRISFDNRTHREMNFDDRPNVNRQLKLQAPPLVRHLGLPMFHPCNERLMKCQVTK